MWRLGLDNRYTMTTGQSGNVQHAFKGTIMKTRFAATAWIIASGLIVGSPAFAEASFEQVKLELTTAVRNGDILAKGESGLKLNELYPARYPAKQVQASATRAQVSAELAAAARTGDIVAAGETGAKLNVLHPGLYPARQAPPTVSRQQVKSELADAIHSGDFLVGGEVGATCKELHPSMHPAA